MEQLLWPSAIQLADTTNQYSQQHAAATHTYLPMSVYSKPGYNYATGPKAANSPGMLAARRGQKARKLKTLGNTSPTMDPADVAQAP